MEELIGFWRHGNGFFTCITIASLGTELYMAAPKEELCD